ncbi:hypothetical protein G7054_g3858 [Neopestalotiopsis clavispora]|nr:hypothetical protein G7054_g3858 [Neopestalotiopsis clavispora]
MSFRNLPSYSVRTNDHPRTLVSSSISGFSRNSSKEVRSLHDLLRHLQPLSLRQYGSTSIRKKRQAGEGASYEVFEGHVTESRLPIAIKRIKVPTGPLDGEKLQHRIDCVLKDIEVMHHPPLEQHENILKILGFGWNSDGRDIIPFIVTDFAQFGTLRTNWYRAPELDGEFRGLKVVEFLRCDMWALGLLCWEVMAAGIRYYELLAAEKPYPQLVSEAPENLDVDPLSHIYPTLQFEAEDYIRRSIGNEMESILKQFLQAIVRRCLHVDPELRPHKITELPFVFGAGLHEGWNDASRKFPLKTATAIEDRWTYEIFDPKVSCLIPHWTKEQVLQDFRRKELESRDQHHGQASLQVALSYANGFGAARDTAKAWEILMTPKCEAAHILKEIILARQQSTMALSNGQHPLTTPFLHLSRFVATSGEPLRKSLETSVSQPAAGLLFASQVGDIDALLSLPWSTDMVGKSLPNPLHYLFMFEDNQKAMRDVIDKCSGIDHELSILMARRNLYQRRRQSQADTSDLEEASIHPEATDSPGFIHLDHTVTNSSIIESCSLVPHIIEPQLPFKLIGTPLNNAVITGSPNTVALLLDMEASPLDCQCASPEHEQKQHLCPLENAVSLHQVSVFQSMWQHCLERPTRQRDLENLCQTGSTILACLAYSSPGERWIMHGADEDLRCSEMIRELLISLKTLFGEIEAGVRTLSNIMVKGCQALLEVQAVPIARKVVGEASQPGIGFEFSTSQIRELLHGIVKLFENGGCDVKVAVDYINFACELEPSQKKATIFQLALAFVKASSRPLLSELLRLHDISEATDDSQRGILWHMIESGFSKLFPISNISVAIVDVNQADIEGETLLQCAIRNGASEDAEFLIQSGADVLQKNSLGETALHTASKANDTETFNRMLTSCLDEKRNIMECCGQDNQGMTPLYYASAHYNIIILEALLGKGVPAGLRHTRTWRTPLHYLFDRPLDKDLRPMFRATEVLQTHGADILYEDSYGISPLELMLQRAEPFTRQHFDIVRQVQPGFGQKPTFNMLELAVKTLKWELVQHIGQFKDTIHREETAQESLFPLLLERMRTRDRIKSKAERTSVEDRCIATARMLLEHYPTLKTKICHRSCITALVHASSDKLSTGISGLYFDLLSFFDSSCDTSVDFRMRCWATAVAENRWPLVKWLLSSNSPSLNIELLRDPDGPCLFMAALRAEDGHLLDTFLQHVSIPVTDLLWMARNMFYGWRELDRKFVTLPAGAQCTPWPKIAGLSQTAETFQTAILLAISNPSWYCKAKSTRRVHALPEDDADPIDDEFSDEVHALPEDDVDPIDDESSDDEDTEPDLKLCASIKVLRSLWQEQCRIVQAAIDKAREEAEREKEMEENERRETSEEEYRYSRRKPGGVGAIHERGYVDHGGHWRMCHNDEEREHHRSKLLDSPFDVSY